MTWNEAKDTILGFFACGLSGYLVYELRLLRESVQKLNEAVALTILRQDFMEKDHGRRIESLEEKIG